MAHAILGAIEARISNSNVAAGAVAGGGGELMANVIAKTLYGVDGTTKTANDLTEAQKNTITVLSQLAGGLAGGLLGDSTQSAVLSSEVSKRAVENNFDLNRAMTDPSYTKGLADLAKVRSRLDLIEEEATKEVVETIQDPDRVIPHYISGEFTLYKYSGKIAVNTRNLDLSFGGGANPITFPTTGISGAVQIGWVTNFTKNELGDNLATSINNALRGSSLGGTICYGVYCAGASKSVITNNPKYLFNIGFGGGFSAGYDYMKGVSNESN